MIPKYTILERTDGLGGQLITLSLLINFAEKFDVKVICDMRTFSYFLGSNTSLISEYKPTDLIDFHPRIVSDIDCIMSIQCDEIFDWHKIQTHQSIITWLTESMVPSDRHVNEYVKKRSSYEAWTSLVNSKDRLTETSYETVKPTLPLKVKHRKVIDEYKPRVENSISVHARLGNGETEMTLRSRGNLHSNLREYYSLGRMTIDPNIFIEEMKKHDDTDFFICTDTQSFFELCKDVFGDRVYRVDRDWLPPGWGPGHNITTEPYSYDPDQLENKSCLNPWDRLCADLIDMELLCMSKHLICNPSQFNYFARKAQPHTHLK